jgi:flagellar basal-body rod protein FlgG
MIRGLYTAASGLKGQTQRLDIVANNIANVNTTGFKKSDGVFRSYFIREILREDSSLTSIGKLSSGVEMVKSQVNHRQGALKNTERNLDFAVDGDGFFRIQRGNEELYTRDGAFHVNQFGFLVTQEGYGVLSDGGRPINLGSGNVEVAADGTIYKKGEVLGKLGLISFPDKDGLRQEGGQYFAIADRNIMSSPFKGTVIQGFLEQSNVSIIDEMIKMIVVTRSYEATQKVMQAHDSTLDQAANQLGRL